MEYLPIILTVALVHFLAVISPGPDFVMIVRNSLLYSRRSGMWCAVGLGLGILVHVAYSLVGIAVIISQSIVLFNIIKYLGAAYLLYIGYKSLTSKASKLDVNAESTHHNLAPMKAVKTGFLTNVTNPKVTLFFLSLFTLVVSPTTPLWVKLFMGAEMGIVTTLWFMFVAYIVSHHLVKDRVGKVQHFAEKFIGVVLIGLGIKVALSKV